MMGCLRCGPDSKKIDEIMDKYCFIYPSFEMVEEFLFKALKRYDFLAETHQLTDYSGLSVKNNCVSYFT